MILGLEDVCKRYARPSGERVALDRVTLEVDRGQVVGVFGPSGCGKSTLLRIAAGLLAPDSGVVSYCGRRLDAMTSRERTQLRRREIGCVWADQVMSDGLSVLEQVAMPLLVDGRGHRDAERQAREVLLACEADEYAHAEVRELSGGERHRVALARALVTEPRLLLADGGVSRLSLVEQERVMALMRSMARDARVGVLITDSSAGSLIGSDRVLYLSHGRLVNPERRSEGGEVLQFPQRVAWSGQ